VRLRFPPACSSFRAFLRISVLATPARRPLPCDELVRVAPRAARLPSRHASASRARGAPVSRLTTYVTPTSSRVPDTGTVTSSSRRCRRSVSRAATLSCRAHPPGFPGGAPVPRRSRRVVCAPRRVCFTTLPPAGCPSDELTSAPPPTPRCPTVWVRCVRSPAAQLPARRVCRSALSPSGCAERRVCRVHAPALRSPGSRVCRVHASDIRSPGYRAGPPPRTPRSLLRAVRPRVSISRIRGARRAARSPRRRRGLHTWTPKPCCPADLAVARAIAQTALHGVPRGIRLASRFPGRRTLSPRGAPAQPDRLAAGFPNGEGAALHGSPARRSDVCSSCPEHACAPPHRSLELWSLGAHPPVARRTATAPLRGSGSWAAPSRRLPVRRRTPHRTDAHAGGTPLHTVSRTSRFPRHPVTRVTSGSRCDAPPSGRPCGGRVANGAPISQSPVSRRAARVALSISRLPVRWSAPRSSTDSPGYPRARITSRRTHRPVARVMSSSSRP
jgi:hypothetical protein